MRMTVWLLLAAALIAALLLWALRVRRVMRARREMVETSRRQWDKYCRKAARARREGRYDEVLSRSERIYRQAQELYEQGLNHPLYRPFAFLLGFRPLAETAAAQDKETNTTTIEGGTDEMQKVEKVNNIRTAMFEMFGVGSDHAAEETALATPEVVDLPAAEVVEAVPVAVTTEEKRVAQGVSFLASGTVWEGSLRAEGDLDIAGEFHGDITTKGNATLHNTVIGNVVAGDVTIMDCTLTGDVTASGTVIISREGKIEGNVTAREVRCAGQIVGDLTVSDIITLEATARLTGNTVTGSFSVAKGAIICGGVEIKSVR